jgi:epsilon-lactone hydrolase
MRSRRVDADGFRSGVIGNGFSLDDACKQALFGDRNAMAGAKRCDVRLAARAGIVHDSQNIAQCCSRDFLGDFANALYHCRIGFHVRINQRHASCKLDDPSTRIVEAMGSRVVWTFPLVFVHLYPHIRRRTVLDEKSNAVSLSLTSEVLELLLVAAELTQNFTVARLSRLETAGAVREIATRVHIARRMFDHLVARLENRLIERVLLSRLREAFRVAGDEADAQAMIARFRGAYATGQMETLPGFFPPPFYGASDSQSGALPAEARFAFERANRPLLLYTVGGGFIMPPSRRQKLMVQRLAETVGCTIVLGQHRLAPEHPFPAAAKDLARQFEALVEAGSDASEIIMAADTAGASVTLGAMQLLREAGHALPAGIVLFCPWCDLSLSGWSYITRSMTSESPFRMETAAFCARMYLQDENPTHPLASAIYGDLAGFPPILIHTSKNDLHFDDALRLAENGMRTGCDVRLNYWDSPRHHMERLATADAQCSFRIAREFIDEMFQG